MPSDKEIPKYLPINEFMKHIQDADFDLVPLRTLLENLKDTSFGQNFAKALEVITSNTGAHTVLRSDLLHVRGVSEELYHDNYPIRQEIARRIEKTTAYVFDPAVSDPGKRRQIWEALQGFLGSPIDEKTRKEIDLKVPNRFPPSIYRVGWIEGDEVVVRQDDLYSVDRDLEPNNILNVNEHTYTIIKEGEIKGRISLAELSDYNRISQQSVIYTKVSNTPLSSTYFTDKISGAARNEFVYLGPQSPYLKPAEFNPDK